MDRIALTTTRALRARVPYGVSWKEHIYIAKYLFNNRDNSPGMQNVYFRFPSVAEKRRVLKAPQLGACAKHNA